MQAGLMCLFEELCIVHCSQEETCMVAAVSWPLLWAVRLETDAHRLKLKVESWKKN